MRYKKAAAWLTVVTVAVLQPCQAYAYTDSNGVYDAEKTARLEDNVLEYGELEDLIREYNPTIAQANIGYYSQITSYQELKSSLEQNRREIKDAAEDLKKEGDMETYELYMDNVKSLNRSQSSIQKNIDSLEEEKSTQDLTRQIYSLTAAAQALMNTYHQFLAKRDMTEKQRQLQESLFRDTQAQAALGMATEAQVQAAEKSLEAAKHTLKSLDDSIESTKRTLCVMTGWSYDASPDIRNLPEPDLAAIDAIDFESDKARAVNNNYDVQSQRRSVKGSASKSQKSTRRSAIEAEEQKSISIDDVFDSLKTKRLEYDAAFTAYQSALQDYNGLQAKKQLGMVSGTEYLQGEADFLEKEADKNVASLALYQAYETYKWAVEGLIVTEEKSA